MISSPCHPQGQIAWPKQQSSCWVGQPVEPRSNKHRQLKQYQQPRYSLQANALLHTADRDVQPAPAVHPGPPLDTNTIAAIVTGKLKVELYHHSRLRVLLCFGTFTLGFVAAFAQRNLQASQARAALNDQ